MSRRRHRVLPAIVAGVALSVALAAAGCAGSKRVQRLRREEIQEKLKTVEAPGLVLGEFPLGYVLDGDTIRVSGLETSLRLAGIDTEETFKTEGDRRLFEAGWEQYLTTKRGKSKHPVKMATPLGEDAKHFAQHFFEGSPKVRLERDSPYELRDTFNRYLAYAFAWKDGRWVNYNIECVRAGMSPYFSKYGYSKRFHQEFVDAERAARAEKIGIWADGAMHYPDYDERKVWWDARADFARQVEVENAKNPDFIVLTHWDSLHRLEQREGRQVTLLGIVGAAKFGDHGPSIASLSRQRGNDFSLVFFDKDVYGSSGVARYRGEFVKVTGTLTRYKRKGSGESSLQMVIKLPGQIVGRSLPGMPPLFPEDDEEAGERAPASTQAPAAPPP